MATGPGQASHREPPWRSHSTQSEQGPEGTTGTMTRLEDRRVLALRKRAGGHPGDKTQVR